MEMPVINVCPFISPFTYTSGNMRLFLKIMCRWVGYIIQELYFRRAKGTSPGLTFKPAHALLWPRRWFKHENIPLRMMNPLAVGHCHAPPIVTLLAPPGASWASPWPSSQGINTGHRRRGGVCLPDAVGRDNAFTKL